MERSGLDRRTVLQAPIAWVLAEAAVPALGALAGRAKAQTTQQAETGESFGPDTVKRLAQQLSQRPFAKPRVEVPEPYGKLTYDQYRDIRFRPEQAIWHGEGLDYELQLFPLGYLYDVPVEIWIVDGGRARALKADSSLFAIGPSIGNAPQAAPFGFSGFRVHGPINRSDVLDEYVVFQGATYFRAVGRGQVYGLSARGLAINIAKPPGEEFPFFRSFWIEKPKPAAAELIVHALLDSPSTTGAYRISVQPGISITMDVEATLFPRREMPHVGLAPLTSMFLHGTAHRRVNSDFRPAVHDSEGLAILAGSGERIWRPLTNPRKLQVSAFIDKDPRGFGLIQRDRSFVNYQDLEAQYHRRPSLWVEPRGGWGEGFVELLEIPADEEIHDNIVAYWRPARPIEANKPFALGYRLIWGEGVPVAWPGARARKTRVGINGKKGSVVFVVDFDGPALKESSELPAPEVGASTGMVSNAIVQRNPEIGGVRCFFELQPGSAELVELRLVLKNSGRQISETWLYRWTKS